jgi:hypothetical protein
MTCQELLRRFTEALERDEVDWGLLRRLVNKCGLSFALEAGRAFAKKTVYMAVARAWALYRGVVISGKDSAVAYGQAVQMIWSLWNWYEIECTPLADISAYVAEAVARYKWPAKWPFLIMPAAAAEEKRCSLPEEVAEALGPDEYGSLEAFLEQGEGVVEVADQKIALVKDGRFIGIVV